ncbi:MAG: ABC transporter substrate-binding protein [candidate division WOR-3 bacterium]
MSQKAITRILIVVNLILMVILFVILWLPGRVRKGPEEARLYFMRDISSLPFWIAQEKGFFDSVGVKIRAEEVVRVGDEIAMVRRGTVVLGVGFPWDALVGKADTGLVNFRVVYSLFGTPEKPATALISMKGFGVARLNDLTGKRIGYWQDTREALEIPAILLSLGVDTSGIKMVALSSGEMPTAFADNRCDAMLVFEPMRTQYLADSAAVILLEDAFLEKHLAPDGRLPVSVIFTSVPNLKLRREGTVRAIKALNMAVDYMKANPDEAKRIARANLNLPENAEVPLPEFRRYDEEDYAVIESYIKRLSELSVVLFEPPGLKNLYLRTTDIK